MECAIQNYITSRGQDRQGDNGAGIPPLCIKIVKHRGPATVRPCEDLKTLTGFVYSASNTCIFYISGREEEGAEKPRSR